MASEYIDDARVVSDVGADAHTVTGILDTVYVAATGSLIALGPGDASGLVIASTAQGATAIVDGTVYGFSKGIHALADSAEVMVNGRVTSRVTAISFEAGSPSLVISADGRVSGAIAVIVSAGGSSITNSGEILADGDRAVELGGDFNQLVNRGDIVAFSNAIAYLGEATLVRNSGVIDGDISNYAPASAYEITVHNRGSIFGLIEGTIADDTVINRGVTETLDLRGGADYVFNRGLISGNLLLGAENDIYDGQGGAVAGVISSDLGDDTLNAGAGNDTIVAGDGADRVRAGAGDDTIRGGAGADVLKGEAGDDTIMAGEQIDLLIGAGGNDLLVGERGADTLNGGFGADTLTGGDQSDVFVFRAGFGQDLVTDFVAVTGARHDVLQFSRAVFDSLADVQAVASQVGSDVLIKVSAVDSILLQNVSLAQLSADDFSFVA